MISLKTTGKQIMSKRTQAPATAVLLRSEVNADHDATAFLNFSKIPSAAFAASKSHLAFFNSKMS